MARLMMNHEYIVPMTDQTREITLYPNPKNGDPPVDVPCSTSLKPQMNFSTPCFVGSDGMGGETGCSDSPEVPLDILKSLTMEMLTAGVLAVNQGVRDPAGGSIELLLVPLIRLFYTLLVMGVLEDEDLGKVLQLTEPRVFCTDAQRPEDQEEASNDEATKKKDDSHKHGLLQMRLPEAVKLEVNQHQFHKLVLS